jgi:LmbE family N-acetylglucosaminyl deacetylase
MSFFKGKKILAIGPHPDDVEFWAGGTVLRAIKEGADVVYLLFSKSIDVPSAYDRLDYFKKAIKLLGIDRAHHQVFDFKNKSFPKQEEEIRVKLDFIVHEHHPDIILCPSESDSHQDHRVITECIKQVFKNITILGYNSHISSWKFDPQLYIALDNNTVEKKIKVCNCYEDVKAFKHYGREPSLRGQLAYWGAKIGAEYAEAFEIIRMVV